MIYELKLDIGRPVCGVSPEALLRAVLPWIQGLSLKLWEVSAPLRSSWYILPGYTFRSVRQHCFADLFCTFACNAYRAVTNLKAK